jgi:hydroxymethylpyrimidine pyrophosphatase-like HAD family hydrolase
MILIPFDISFFLTAVEYITYYFQPKRIIIGYQMKYFALACDYDGTLAKHGKVNSSTVSALEKIRNSGRKLLLVTGRELDELLDIFPEIKLFDLVVAENGALLYYPENGEEKALGDAPPKEFIDALKTENVSPFSVGRVITATWKPHEDTVLRIIRDLGLEMQIIFNKDAVMVLPSGINKAYGLSKALYELNLSPLNVVAVGDAENDHAFFRAAGFSAAVSNSVSMLKETADLCLNGDHGDGVIELAELIIKNDLQDYEDKIKRHKILLGKKDEEDFCIKSYNKRIFVAGSSGGGKSTFALSFIETLNEKGYQYCIIDPEGDYEDLKEVVSSGSGQRPPDVDRIMRLLEDPTRNTAVSLVSIPFDDRPAFFKKFYPSLYELNSRSGRPHWVIIDETHHIMPADWSPAVIGTSLKFPGILYIAVHPDHVERSILSSIDILVVIGDEPEETFELFCSQLSLKIPRLPKNSLEKGEAILWEVKNGNEPFLLKTIPPKIEKSRHTLKYAEGELDEEASFYFKGPEGKLKLRAHNLQMFLRLAEGVDDETWLFHLKNGEYSKWFRSRIRDDELADEAEKVERNKNSDAEKSREIIKNKIQERYTGPA